MPKSDTVWSKIALIVILIVAATLRLARPGVVEFKLDEATVARSALAFVHHGAWPTLGQTTSLGLPNPPLSVYVQALPFAVSRNPAVAAFFLGALGVLAVALTYLLGAYVFDRRVGLIASALFAVSPWAVFYSRKLWTQNLPAVTLAFMLALYALVVKRKPCALTLVLTALGALVGLYAGDIVFVGVFVLALLLRPRVWQVVRWRWAVLGVLGALIFTIPFLLGLASTLSQPPALPSEISSFEFRLSSSWSAFLYPLQMATGFQFHALAGDRFMQYRAQLPPFFLIDIIEIVLVGLGILYVTYRALTAAPKHRERYMLLVLWFWLPVLVWVILGGQHVYPHHFILLYPVQHLAVAVMFVEAIGYLKDSARTKDVLLTPSNLAPSRPLTTVLAWATLAAVLALIVVWDLVTYLTMRRFVDSYPIHGGHGEPIHYAWDAAQRARDLTEGDDLPIVVLTDGFDPRYTDGAAAFDAMLGDRWLYLLPGDEADLHPVGGGVRLSRRGFGDYEVSQILPAEDWGPPVAHLANGVDLLSLRVEELPQPGRPLEVMAYWRIWGIPPVDEDYSFSVQLFTEGGMRLGQVDTHFLPTDRWYPGDQIIWRVALLTPLDAPPEADYTLLVVMYSYPDLRGVALLDAQGNPSGEHALIPLEAALDVH